MSNTFRRSKTTEQTNPYEFYGFVQNPFPVDPTVKPFSLDRRENGSIFLEDLRSQELEEFQQKIIKNHTKIGFLMDYAAYKGRGIGKTAFMNYVKNLINKDLGDTISEGEDILYAIYVSPSPDKRERSMSLIARNIYSSMLRSDIFLIAFSRLRAFSGIISDTILEEIGDIENYEGTIANDEWLQAKGVNISELNGIVEQTLTDIGIDISLSSHQLFNNPNSYQLFYKRFDIDLSDYNWKKIGCDFLFNDIVRLLKAADISHCVILLDEVEKIITYQNFAEKRAFCDNLRNYFIDGQSINAVSSYFKILMTIHPNSQELLMPHWKAAGLERFSELGGSEANNNTVFFRPIQNTGEMALKLTCIYMNNAKLDNRSIDNISPFTEDALNAIMLKAENIPGKFLKYMYNIIEKGIENQWETIDVAKVETMWSTTSDTTPTSDTLSLPETKTIL